MTMTDDTIKTEITDDDVAGHGLHTGAQRFGDAVAATEDDTEGHGWNRVRNQVPDFDESGEDEEVEGHRIQSELRATDDVDQDGEVEGHRIQSELRATDDDDDDDVEGHRLHHGHH
jgi:hypothetical protein